MASGYFFSLSPSFLNHSLLSHLLIQSPSILIFPISPFSYFFHPSLSFFPFSSHSSLLHSIAFPTSFLLSSAISFFHFLSSILPLFCLILFHFFFSSIRLFLAQFLHIPPSVPLKHPLLILPPFPSFILYFLPFSFFLPSITFILSHFLLIHSHLSCPSRRFEEGHFFRCFPWLMSC